MGYGLGAEGFMGPWETTEGGTEAAESALVSITDLMHNRTNQRGCQRPWRLRTSLPTGELRITDTQEMRHWPVTPRGGSGVSLSLRPSDHLSLLSKFDLLSLSLSLALLCLCMYFSSRIILWMSCLEVLSEKSNASRPQVVATGGW